MCSIGRIIAIGLVWILSASSVGIAFAQDTQTTDEQERTRRYCASLSEAKRRQTEMCKTPQEQREDDYQRRKKEAEAKERSKNTSFLKWVHTDGLWLPGNSKAGLYGIAGVHVVVANLGRLYFFGPPGLMLVMENTSEGRRFRPGLTWGVSFHMTDFTPPGTRRQAELYLNVSKVWTRGDYNQATDLFGLSVTWKKK